ncbi:hypothetical protein AVEN_275057-1 [Araneus ventricosus]|uniref:Uncharacterized protein n=1 Tax=Araneus ventricosus TaxID=182803 RepID=A0A4Y2MPT7_ARAVE|nr:hypothetical protein AVEN_275057-1 [Araneus ventricosus]
MSMQRKLLEEINNMSKLCSEIDEEENSVSENGTYHLLVTDSELSDTDNEEENIVNTPRIPRFTGTRNKKYGEHFSRFHYNFWKTCQIVHCKINHKHLLYM